MAFKAPFGARAWEARPDERSPWPEYTRLCRAYRLRTGLTQRSFALLIGVKQGSVTKWECGRACPTPQHIVQICRTVEAWCTDRPGGDEKIYTALYDALIDAATANSLNYKSRARSRARLEVGA